MQPDTRKILFDIQNAIEETNDFLKDSTKEQFLKNRLVQVAVEREVEVIGEALNRLQRLGPEVFDLIDKRNGQSKAHKKSYGSPT